jgi:hypothetical protein
MNLTPKQLAERWNVSVRTLANWRCANVGPAYLKINGTRVVYALSDIEAYEDHSRVEAAA